MGATESMQPDYKTSAPSPMYDTGSNHGDNYISYEGGGSQHVQNIGRTVPTQ